MKPAINSNLWAIQRFSGKKISIGTPESEGVIEVWFDHNPKAISSSFALMIANVITSELNKRAYLCEKRDDTDENEDFEGYCASEQACGHRCEDGQCSRCAKADSLEIPTPTFDEDIPL